MSNELTPNFNTHTLLYVHVCTHRTAGEGTVSVSPTPKVITAHRNSQQINSHQPSAHQEIHPVDSSSTPAQKDNTSKVKKNGIHQREEVSHKRENENCVQQKRDSPKKSSQLSSDTTGPLWREARKQLVSTCSYW